MAETTVTTKVDEKPGETPGDENNQEQTLTAEEIQALRRQAANAQKYSEEAATARVKAKELREEKDREIAEVRKQLVELSDKSKDNPEVARLARELTEIKTEREEEKRQAQEETERAKRRSQVADLKGVIGELKLNSPEEALELMLSKSRYSADGVTEYRMVVDGEEKWIAANAANFSKHKPLTDLFWPSEGVGGSGSRGRLPVGGTLAGKIDWNRVNAGDYRYIKEHEKEIDAELDRHKRAGVG